MKTPSNKEIINKYDQRRRQYLITQLDAYIAQLETELEDANRKLAALGHFPTRSLSQQEWDDCQAELAKDFQQTRKDAYNSGNP